MKRTPLRRVSPNKVKKVKKVKKKTTSQLKKHLDKVFSIYIRNKYAINGYVQCYTCGVTKSISEMQNGHFISRSYLATRFLEQNVRPQCVGCNVFGGGKPVEFARKLEIEEDGIVDWLYREAQKITNDYPYQKQIEYYEERTKGF